MSDTLHVCPRCDAYVQPDWPTCKICGYDPRHAAQQGEPIALPSRPRQRREPMGAGQVLGALATLAVLIGLGFGAVKGGVYWWEHRDNSNHQEFVTIPK